MSVARETLGPGATGRTHGFLCEIVRRQEGTAWCVVNELSFLQAPGLFSSLLLPPAPSPVPSPGLPGASMNEAPRVQASTLEGTIFPLRFLVGLCDRGAGRAALGLPTSENSQERPLSEKDLQPRQCGSHNLNYTAAPRSCPRGGAAPEGLGCPKRCRGCSGCGGSRPSTPGSSLVSLLEAELWGQELELVSGEGLLCGQPQATAACCVWSLGWCWDRLGFSARPAHQRPA